MDPKKLEESQQTGGIHFMLSSLSGEWEGNTKTWFEPGKLADESQWRGSIRSLLGGRFIQHEYSYELLGQAQQGLAIYGYNLSRQKFECSWIDTGHMGSGIMACEGERRDDGFAVLGFYGGNGDTPAWGWRTEIAIVDQDHIVISAFNITPEGLEAKALETQYRRRTAQ